VTTGSTAAVYWPCKGSAITCLLIRDLYEWLDEGLTVSPLQSVKLIYPCRSGYNTTRREDPLELKVQNSATSNNFIKSKNLLAMKFYLRLGRPRRKNKPPSGLGQTPKAKKDIFKPQNIWPIMIRPIRPISGPSYPRDNSAILSQSPYRRGGLRPRCWIRTSWWCSRY